MVHTQIIIRTKEDQEPAFPEITEETFHGEGELYGVSILEQGMVSGKTSIGFAIKLADGKFVMAETSAAILNMIHGALQGAEARFLDLKAGRQ